MAKISLKKALKIKDRMLAQMTTLKSRALENNSYETGTTPDYDSSESLLEYIKVQDSLVKLKVLIHKANAPVYDKIFGMSEAKSQITTLKAMDVKPGRQRGHYGSGEAPMNVVTIGQLKRDQMVSALEVSIESFQEDLDQHNSTVSIEWE